MTENSIHVEPFSIAAFVDTVKNAGGGIVTRQVHYLADYLDKLKVATVIRETRSGSPSSRSTEASSTSRGRLMGNCARGIADGDWSTFERMIRYKLHWSGGQVKLVPAPYSSQECGRCEHVDATSRRGEVYCCTKCGHRDHADINAAKVLLRRANRSVLPVEGVPLEGALRSRKVKRGLRVSRRSSSQSSDL